LVEVPLRGWERPPRARVRPASQGRTAIDRKSRFIRSASVFPTTKQTRGGDRRTNSTSLRIKHLETTFFLLFASSHIVTGHEWHSDGTVRRHFCDLFDCLYPSQSESQPGGGGINLALRPLTSCKSSRRGCGLPGFRCRKPASLAVA
jgi:hypothetical protein